MLVKIEEHGDDAGDVIPIVGIVGLEHEQPAGLEAAMDVGQEAWGQ